MLYNLEWLWDNKEYPPKCEENRLRAYTFYKGLFDLTPFTEIEFQNFGRAIFSNFDEYFRFPALLSYQRLTTLKLADMVIGAPPAITVTGDDELTDTIGEIRDRTDFNGKIYSALIDYSRYGVTVLRAFNDDECEEQCAQFAVWEPSEWFPIIKDDGTHRVKEQVICWRQNVGTEIRPVWRLHVQRHPTKGGYYIHNVYAMDAGGKQIIKKIRGEKETIGELPCLVQTIVNVQTSSNVYGTSDYKIINDLVHKAIDRMRQIIKILDDHSDPSLVGPSTLLMQDEQTGEMKFKTGKYYAVGPEEMKPEYLTWNGQLDAAFKGLEFLLNQIYILSEMGDAFLGATNGSGATAVSGTAMRYKMLSPLEKARRVCNTFTLPIKKLISTLLQIETGKKIPYTQINVAWQDSLPKDPREQAELVRLQTGAPEAMPMLHALEQAYGLSVADATHWLEEIKKDQKYWQNIAAEARANANAGNTQTGSALNSTRTPSDAAEGYGTGESKDVAGNPNARKKGGGIEPSNKNKSEEK